MYRAIIITALCGGILVGSVIGGSYMIATAIRQAGDRQVDAIQQAADQQSLATEEAAERPYQEHMRDLERSLGRPLREWAVERRISGILCKKEP
jgi:hypothetical protein